MIFGINVYIDTSPEFLTFAFAFVTLKVINSEIILFHFALLSVSMVFSEPFQGVFRYCWVFSGCFQGVFPYPLCGLFAEPLKHITGKSLDSPEKGNVDKMSEKCRKKSPQGLKAQFRTFFDDFCPFGQGVCLVSLSNARPLQPKTLENEKRTKKAREIGKQKNKEIGKKRIGG